MKAHIIGRVCLSVPVFQFDIHWADFHENRYWRNLWKIMEYLRFPLLSDKCNVHSTWSPRAYCAYPVTYLRDRKWLEEKLQRKMAQVSYVSHVFSVSVTIFEIIKRKRCHEWIFYINHGPSGSTSCHTLFLPWNVLKLGWAVLENLILCQLLRILEPLISPTLFPALSQLNPLHGLVHLLFELHINIVLVSAQVRGLVQLFLVHCSYCSERIYRRLCPLFKYSLFIIKRCKSTG
jgi:hypothetical protein